MKTILAVAVSVLLSAPFAGAQEQRDRPPEIKLLTPAQCALITKRSDSEFYVKGPVDIGNATYEESVISRNGVSFNGVDNFDVINRSCFVGKPL